MGMTRIEGWESRLVAVIEGARGKPYKIGEHDCLRIACDAVQALTGVDVWAEWSGKYTTAREARKVIARYSLGGTLADAITKRLAVLPSEMRTARRGDLAEYVDIESHIGVCLGADVAVLGPTGLAFVPLPACVRAWRVG